MPNNIYTIQYSTSLSLPDCGPNSPLPETLNLPPGREPLLRSIDSVSHYMDNKDRLVAVIPHRLWERTSGTNDSVRANYLTDS